MKIKVTHTTDEDNCGQYAGVMTELTTNEGILSVNFAGGEPEDMTLNRDLSDAWGISTMLVRAYNAGKNGEQLEIEKITAEE
jgi:hypothetical protein